MIQTFFLYARLKNVIYCQRKVPVTCIQRSGKCEKILGEIAKLLFLPASFLLYTLYSRLVLCVKYILNRNIIYILRCSLAESN